MKSLSVLGGNNPLMWIDVDSIMNNPISSTPLFRNSHGTSCKCQRLASSQEKDDEDIYSPLGNKSAV